LTKHWIYRTIISAVKEGRLKEPFSRKDLQNACPDLNKNTCLTFPAKHRIGNPGKNTELFIRITKQRFETVTFKLVRPFKYGLS